MICLTQLAVGKRSVTLLIAISLFLGGIVSWTQLNQELLPNIDLPIVVIVTPLPGAGAEDVTAEVTEPVERAVAEVPRLEHTSSSSANSVSIVVAQFSYGTNVKDTKTAIEQNVAALSLPSGATPKVQALDLSALAPVTVAIQAAGSTSQEELARFTQSTILPALQGIDGVSSVDMSGGISQRLMISLDPMKLVQAGISVNQIQGVLQANNLTLPAGQLSTGQTSVPVSAMHQFTSVDEISNLVVGVKMPASASGQGSGTSGATASQQPADPSALPTPIRLADLGTVGLVDVQASGYARLNTQPSLVLTISKSTDGNTVNVADGVQAKLAELQAQYGSTFTVTTIQDLSTYIKESSASLVREGGLGALFAVLVIFMFLLSLRSTLVAAVSIPLSIMTALVLMYAGGITINIMTLGGLAVAVGRVVDDAIVVLENIYRHRGRGDPMRVAVISGTREVASAITSSTLTTVAVFLPLGFVGGIVSQFFLPFALTVTFALLSSLVCALTVVPVLASLFIDRITLNPDEGPAHHETIAQRIYTPLLRRALQSRSSRWGVIGIAALLVVVTGLLLPHIPTQFLNAGSEKYLTVTVSPPVGSPSTVVLAKAEAIENQLHTNPEVNLIETSIPAEGDTGTSALAAIFTGRSSNSATINVRLDDSVDLTAEQQKLIGQLTPLDGSGWKIEVAQQAMTGGGTTIDVVVSGADAKNVASATQAILAALQGRSDLVNVKSDLAVEAPEIQVQVDPNKAILAGTTTAQVQSEIHAALAGQQVTTAVLQTGPTPVYVQVNPAGIYVARDARPAAGRHRPGAAGLHRDRPGGPGAGPRLARGPVAGIDRDGGHHRPGHRRGFTRRPEADRSARGGRQAPGRHRHTVGHHRADEHGLRRPVRVDGRGHPAGLPRHGAGLRLPRGPAGHHVQPAAGHGGRIPGAVPDRSRPVDQRADRVPDAHRDRRDQCHRAAGPRRAAPAARPAHVRGADAGRADQGAPDPDDGDRHDPGAHPAGPRPQPGRDHRLGTGDGRHRRALQLDLPDADRRAGGVRTGRGREGLGTPAIWLASSGGRRGRIGDRTGTRTGRLIRHR